MDVNVWLSNFVNDNESINELLLLVVQNTESMYGTLFISESNQYNSICFVSKEKTIDFNIKVRYNLDDIVSYNSNEIHYTKDFFINNNITIPIKNKDKILGLLCLFNSSKKYCPDDVVNKITPFISIIQIFLYKEQLKNENIVLKEKLKWLFL